ncbi:MAG: acyltransferase [Lachnospiraceae bacterium]|nr:acyltransferase [Lachnospiraceae bacterium]
MNIGVIDNILIIFMLQSLLFLVVVLICIRMTFLSTPVVIRGIFDLQLTNAYRGVAILFVMSQHVGGALGTNILTPLGGIGVAIFLLLSGYGLSESYKAKGLDGWIKKKMIRVWIPFLCTYVVIFALREDCGWIKFIRQVLTIDRSEYWYVDYILRCYMVFYIAYRWLYKYRMVAFRWFCLIFFLFNTQWTYGRAIT